ncbi:sensor histidine kinase [Spectribacter hydrogenooxidans]|uniref:histidine kinase n=1 Tax=Spectribacter hydrogenoxidans TaxID=3075608 RepID=A0ABU3C3Y4_9GAMM|nr:ATP-binding protein [Salinisphaera sp. W335]MDT0636273.1 ATP-binding protein [Salinisphaera sp. W335]
MNERPAVAPGTADFADLFEHAPTGYMQLDGAGAIVRINQSGAAMLGWPAQWLAGKPFSRWVTQDDKPLFEDHRHRLRASGLGEAQELRIKNRQGRQLRLRLQSLREAGPQGEHGACRSILLDISRDAQAAQDARQLQAELSLAARRHAAGELAASLAHELNQPLGTVMLNCETALALLNTGSMRDCEFAAALAQATEAASYASEIVRHLRGFLRKGDEQRRVCAVADLITEVATLIETDARDHDVELRIDLADSLPRVGVVAVQIEQVLVNLVHNAVEAIGADCCPRRVTIRADTGPANDVRIAVEDTGPGVDRTVANRMFEPFFTSKNGLGMGLAISRGIVEAHGGRLWACNDPGGGARLQFTLPPDGDNAY